MSKNNLGIMAVICLFCAAALFVAILLCSRNGESRLSGKLLVPPGPEAKSHVPKDLRQAINDGLKRLDGEDFDQAKCGGTGTGLARCSGDYILVAVDKDAKQTLVHVYRGKKSDPPAYKVELEPGWQKSRVGINVPLAITHPPDKTVVALLTVVTIDGVAREMAYAPYSSSLDTPEMRAAGLRYLEELYAKSAATLDSQGVRSGFFKQPVTASSDKTHIATLVLTEQVFDADRFAAGDEKLRLSMVNRTLVLLAANGPGAYPLSISRKGAVGIAQIMPTTYAKLASLYPKAELPRDSAEGRTQHESAIRAMILHADNQWWAINGNKKYAAWLKGHPTEKSYLFAAGYNASMGTIVEAVQACKERWLDASCHQTPPETRIYLIKYKWIRDLLTNSSFRQDVAKKAGL